jgi:4-alpha-glucanotransferase
MLFNRESGILLHPTSLPGPYGVGELGPAAFRFVDFLAETRQGLWQVLPLTPAGQGFSPYHCSSSFASNVLLLSFEALAEEGWLDLPEALLAGLEAPELALDPDRVLEKKLPLLRMVAARFRTEAPRLRQDAFEAFRDRQPWLRDFARFIALGRHFEGRPWHEWPLELRRRDPSALARADQELAVAIDVEEVLQFLIESQWQTLRKYANRHGVRIVGDVPIFVAHDSADVWAAQELFQLDDQGKPTVVSGVPPDYFSATGQRWGNPMYAWDRHLEQGFEWWLSRLGRTFAVADIVRIDHFRGFAACWEIPAAEPTAIRGRWMPAPGKQLFRRLVDHFGADLPIIAEDLGIITDDVVELRDDFGLPTMRVVQFSFNGEEAFLPRNFPENCVAYTGTHDNDTLVGWHRGAVEGRVGDSKAIAAERDQVRRYYSTDGTDIHWTCIRALLESRCAAVIVPMQDVLGLGSEARMNTPGTVGDHNWRWRFSWDQLDPAMVTRLREMTEAAHRNTRHG